MAEDTHIMWLFDDDNDNDLLNLLSEIPSDFHLCVDSCVSV